VQHGDTMTSNSVATIHTPCKDITIVLGNMLCHFYHLLRNKRRRNRRRCRCCCCLTVGGDYCTKFGPYNTDIFWKIPITLPSQKTDIITVKRIIEWSWSWLFLLQKKSSAIHWKWKWKCNNRRKKKKTVTATATASAD